MSNTLFSRAKIRNITGAFLLFVGGSLAFTYIANQVFDGDSERIDYGILHAVQAIQTPLLTEIVQIVTIFGSVAMIGLFTLFLSVYLLQLHKRRLTIFTIVSMGGVLAIFSLLKLIFERDRPFLYNLIYESTYSFPSGHAALSCAFALILLILAWRSRYRLAFVIGGILYILSIGLSRVYLTVHYPTDILAGWILAIIWVLTTALTLGIITLPDKAKR